MILGSNDIIERYIWNLTYTPGTPPPPDGGTVPGFTILSLIAAITAGIMIIIGGKKKIQIN